MFLNAVAEIRPDLMVVAMEGSEADKFFVAERIFPLFGSQTKIGEYRKIKKGSGNLLEMPDEDHLLRAPNTAYKQTDRTYEKAGFITRDRGLEEPIDDSVAADIARHYDAQKVTTRGLVTSILRSQEKRVAAKVHDEATWGKIDPVAAYTSGNLTNDTIDVAEDVEALIATIQKRGELVNTLQMSKNLWRRVKKSTKLRKYIFGDNAGGKIITKAEFLAAFSEVAPIENFLITEATYSTVAKGKQPTDAQIGYIWGDSYMWAGNVTGGGPELGGAGRIFYWEEMVEGLYVVESRRDEEKVSDVIRVRQFDEEHVVNECAGCLLKTNYAP